MRYFLDTEFNGFGGDLLSLALVPEDGGDEFYVTLKTTDPIEPWVERNVIPFLGSVPSSLRSAPLEREEAARSLSAWLVQEDELQSLAAYPDQNAFEIIADWPEDLAQFCMLLLKGPGAIVPTPQLRFQLVQLPNFSTAANSAVPHNALHDARALREHILALEP